MVKNRQNVVHDHILTFNYHHYNEGTVSKVICNCQFHARLLSYLLVDICPIVDQQLQTEGTIGGDSGQVQRGVAALVGLVNISSMVHQLGSHSLLSHVASHMERSISKAIGLINLTAEHKQTPDQTQPRA